MNLGKKTLRTVMLAAAAVVITQSTVIADPPPSTGFSIQNCVTDGQFLGAPQFLTYKQSDTALVWAANDGGHTNWRRGSYVEGGCPDTSCKVVLKWAGKQWQWDNVKSSFGIKALSHGSVASYSYMNAEGTCN